MIPEVSSSHMDEDNAPGTIVLTSEHVRAARALLRWDQKTLAEKSKVSVPTIKRLEPISGPLKANKVTRDALQRALEQAGVEFIPENGGGVGVRLTHSYRKV
ncbi:helix-turn-helix domain-containing protein [Aminobacter aminovorans]|nr:transcriptional regulator [Aminobacter aminovorans]